MKKQIIFIITTISLLALGIVACSNGNQWILPAGTKPVEPEPEPEPEDPNAPKTINYVEVAKNIANPERGFYTYKQFKGATETDVMTPEFVKEFRDQSITLIFNTYLLQDFIDKPIGDQFLQRIRTNMQALRDGGSKTVLRFCYTDKELSAAEIAAGKQQDAPWDVMQGHFAQLKPIFDEYVDVISLLEAGFIGAWGEWYYTTHYIFNPQDDQYGPRKQVLDGLLKLLPKERMVAIRYPKAKILSFGITHNEAITVEDAYNGTDLSRVAAHNDCFLADQDDRGTFGGNRNYRTYWEKESQFYVMGGETCKMSSFAECDNALDAMKAYHWSYININYNKDVLNHWTENGCMEEIQQRLGYKFVLEKGTFDKKAKASKKYTMKLELTNKGWAAPYNPRNVEIIFAAVADPAKKHIIKLTDDPRFWFADQKIELDLKLDIPASLDAGKYNIYINLPDPKETLANKPEFSIQLANENTWEAATGYNKLFEVEVEK